MPLISPNYDVKSIIYSQFWPGAFSKNCWKKPCLASAKLFDILIVFLKEIFDKVDFKKVIGQQQMHEILPRLK